MNLYNSSLYIEDLIRTIKNYPYLKEFENHSVFLTGSTGLIGSAVADILLYYSQLKGGSVKVYVAGRDKKKTEDRFSRYCDKSFFEFVKYDACKDNELNFSADYIIHCASNAYPSVIQKLPVETMNANFFGMLKLLEFAKKCSAAKTVFVSSSEIYGKKEKDAPFKETEYGYVDILSLRSAYPMAKRATETLCACYAVENNISVSIVRPGHIFGPTATKNDSRVSSVFAYNAAEGEDIVLKSEGRQIRSYCYAFDCATAILLVALKGESGQAYNIAAPTSIMSIRKMAELYAEYGGVKIKFMLPTTKEQKAFNPMDNSSLNSDKLLSLGWYGSFSNREGIEHTVRILKEANEQ